MGIYGYGKAFNLRYAHNSYTPQRTVYRSRQPIMTQQTVTTNTNINIKNGPSGFWGFMSGLFGGMGLGGMFGGGMGMGGFSPFGMLNTQMAQPAINQPKTGDRLADLQKMFPNWIITSDGNGNYDAVNKDQTVHEKGDFDTMCEKLLNHKEEPQGAKVESETDKKAEVDKKPEAKDTDKKTDNSIKWDSLSEMTCRDEKGKTANISGSLQVGKEKGENDYPKTLTITDKSSGQAHKYTFELAGIKDGKPIYKCTNMNGQKVKDNEYTLITLNNGKPELVQSEGQQNFGLGL